MTIHRFLLAISFLLTSCAPSGGQPATTSAAGTTGTWSSPLGIPMPSFGVKEVAPTAPSPWTTEVAGFYYVNGSTGTDSGRVHGTPSAPRATIPNPIPAGAVVKVEGAYTQVHTGGRGLRLEGTASRPCFIQGVQGVTVVDSWEIGGSYCIVEGIKFGPGGSWMVLAPADHIALRDNEFVGTPKGSGGIGVAIWTAGTNASDIVLLRNNVHHSGDWQATFDQDSHGTGLYRSSDVRGTAATISNVWILDSKYSYNSGDGVQVNANDGSDKIHHIYIGRNVAHHNKQTGFWLKNSSDVVLSEGTNPAA